AGVIRLDPLNPAASDQDGITGADADHVDPITTGATLLVTGSGLGPNLSFTLTKGSLVVPITGARVSGHDTNAVVSLPISKDDIVLPEGEYQLRAFQDPDPLAQTVVAIPASNPITLTLTYHGYHAEGSYISAPFLIDPLHSPTGVDIIDANTPVHTSLGYELTTNLIVDDPVTTADESAATHWMRLLYQEFGGPQGSEVDHTDGERDGQLDLASPGVSASSLATAGRFWLRVTFATTDPTKSPILGGLRLVTEAPGGTTGATGLGMVAPATAPIITALTPNPVHVGELLTITPTALPPHSSVPVTFRFGPSVTELTGQISGSTITVPIPASLSVVGQSTEYQVTITVDGVVSSSVPLTVLNAVLPTTPSTVSAALPSTSASVPSYPPTGSYTSPEIRIDASFQVQSLELIGERLWSLDDLRYQIATNESDYETWLDLPSPAPLAATQPCSSDQPCALRGTLIDLTTLPSLTSANNIKIRVLLGTSNAAHTSSLDGFRLITTPRSLVDKSPVTSPPVSSTQTENPSTNQPSINQSSPMTSESSEASTAPLLTGTYTSPEQLVPAGALLSQLELIDEQLWAYGDLHYQIATQESNYETWLDLPNPAPMASLSPCPATGIPCLRREASIPLLTWNELHDTVGVKVRIQMHATDTEHISSLQGFRILTVPKAVTTP
ncbi:hypothetical protein HY524_02175, partial [Candidatus Berkelbacteria bacterium]|nr:hypothetical protein [Candidatus Berkelbacteria bacterium]